ncbi:tetratricopeptide repeat protein [Flavobacterium sp. 3HN19-14]|uniref:tetratricopeptide repeat protein n=1 Tax=Flavobacterium sp. 3HN19-14 TaxID=3448133 RepID=UPI003EE25E26
MVECYQQLSQFQKAETLLNDQYAKFKQANLLVELGYNYQLQKNPAQAKKYYDLSLDEIRKIPANVYSIAATFERRVIPDYALKAYELGQSLEPKYNFNYQMGVIYGQLGNVEKMIDTFLDESFKNPQSYIMIQNQLAKFMTEDEESEATFNTTLKKALLLRSQKSHDIFWNQYLSWFYVQQKDYGKAFIQEKAIYKRNPETFANIVNLAQLAMDEGDDETARDIFSYVLENTQDAELQIRAHTFLMSMKIQKATEKDFPAIKTELDALLAQFGINPFSLPLQILEAHFVTFNMNNPELGKTMLKAALDININKYQAADVKMELADILLFEQKFNQGTDLLFSD